MKYFIIALLFIAAAFGIHNMTVKMSPDRSVETGLQRNLPKDEDRVQSQEDMSVWDQQRENRNNVPRHK